MAHMDPASSITAKLTSLYAREYPHATKHPFLAKAGNGTIPESAVCKWLVQDKYYQLAYVNFIGGLLAKLDLFPWAFPSQSAEHKIKGESLSRVTLTLLIDSLTAIRQEIDFYDKTADEYELELEYAPPDNVTKQYMELFAEVSAKKAPLVYGLVVLCATESCYLRAWTYASETAAQSQPNMGNNTGAVAALHKKFIPNWTSVQFREFVEKLATVTDAWAWMASAATLDACERLWVRVLQLESNFWPEV